MTRALTRLLLLSTVFPMVLRAQDGSGFAVTGTVLDPQRAGVLEAKVTLKRADGAEMQVTVADSRGAFRFEGVPPGNYDVRIEHQGFKPSIARVQVGTQAPRPLTVLLAIADVRQEITVGGDELQVSTATSANLDTVTLNRSALDNLPIFDQDYIATMSRFLDSSSMGTTGVTLVVDGVEASRAGISASAIQEVKINQDPYSAEYSRPGRGRIEIITKPGSAEFHGTFNFLFRDYRLNARDPFALTRPPEQRRIFEGNLTGPLGKGKKTSFLISANREEEDAQATVFALGPSGEIRQTVATPQRNTELTGGMNYQISGNHLISIRGVYTDRTIQNQGVGGFTLPEAGTNFEDREDIIYFNHNGLLTKRLANQFRLLVARQHTPTTSINPGPKIVVLGAFTGGGAQGDRLQTENHIALNEILVWSGAKHTIRTGINVPDISRRGLDDNTNTAGTYTFSTLQDYQQNHPFSLLRQSGNGHVVFVEKVLGGFFQDEFRVFPNLQISAGVRYDWQNYFHDNNNFSPRFSLAYAPGKAKKTVIRSGAGFFYDRTGPGPIFDLIRYDGNRLRQYLINNPIFPDPLAVGPTSVVRLDPTVQIPYSLQYGASVERQVGKSTILTVSYTGLRGVHLFRSRDVNAPPPPYTARPDSSLSVWRQIESAGDLESHSLEIGLRGNVTRYFTGMVQYTLGRAYNNVGGTTAGGGRASGINSFPANNYDLSGEWSRADFNQRNRFSLLGTVTPGRYFKLGVSLSLYSGQPYTETSGRDDNHDGLANDRPPGVRRNSLQGPGYADLDLRWSRDFFLSPSKKDKGPTVTLGIDAFNVLNRVNYVNYVGDLNSPFFGKPIAAQPTRRLQVSFRLSF
ncbi:MAG TPA: TonB-dependent receptor [Terriglobales bacterium]|nr:TonB-dependent receptor [Terriglobales bacterium]